MSKTIWVYKGHYIFRMLSPGHNLPYSSRSLVTDERLSSDTLAGMKKLINERLKQ